MPENEHAMIIHIFENAQCSRFVLAAFLTTVRGNVGRAFQVRDDFCAFVAQYVLSDLGFCIVDAR
jgi:hypothetical protein